VKSVGDMFYAIGVAPEPYVDDVHAGFDALFTENCSAPFTVQFINQSYNGDNFFWNFGDGQTSTQINPSHTYTSMGYFDVQLYVDGTACGNDVLLKDDFVVIDESVPCATMFPTSGNTVINECSGIIYDAGGPVGNYYDNSNASITIHAPGSDYMVLNIAEFNIEAGSGFDCDYDYIAFYDGSSTSASLINSTYYCNTNGNPGTIASTGDYLTIQFYSDGGLNMSGFKILFDCVGGENPPAPYFVANKVYSCEGLISFEDNSLNNPLTWAWDFGDGNSSDEQNPIHEYTASGVYTVSLEVGNSYGTQELVKTDYITVELPDAPIIGDVVACSDQSFTIEYIGDGQLRWFDSPEAETPVYTGNNWQHPAMLSPASYWVDELFAGETHYVGNENAEVGGGYFGNPEYIHYLVFDAYEPCVLESIFINADGDGYRTIALRNSSMEIISQKTVFCPNGAWRVEVNMDIPVGTNLQLAGMGTPNLYRNNVATTVNFPYTIDGVVSIKQSSAGTNPLDYYYYFYDWNISTYECVSALAQVDLVPETCMGVNSELFSEISVSPNPGTGLYVFVNPANSKFDYTITDISGKEVLKANSDKNSFDISNCADGVYFVKIVSDYGTKTLKLVKN
jgi:PKD repeat protein